MSSQTHKIAAAWVGPSDAGEFRTRSGRKAVLTGKMKDGVTWCGFIVGQKKVEMWNPRGLYACTAIKGRDLMGPWEEKKT